MASEAVRKLAGKILAATTQRAYSQNELSKLYGVSRSMVRRAIDYIDQTVTSASEEEDSTTGFVDNEKLPLEDRIIGLGMLNMSGVSIAKQLGVGVKRARAALKSAKAKAGSQPQQREEDTERRDVDVVVTTTKNGCISTVEIKPGEETQLAVGNSYSCDGTCVIVTAVTPDKTVYFIETKETSGTTQGREFLENFSNAKLKSCQWRSWKRKMSAKSYDLETCYELLHAQECAKADGIWDGVYPELSWCDDNGTPYVKLYKDKYVSTEVRERAAEKETGDSNDVEKFDEVITIKSDSTTKIPQSCPFRMTSTSRAITVFEGVTQYSVTSDESGRFKDATVALENSDWDTLLAICKHRHGKSDLYKKALAPYGFVFEGGFIRMNNQTGKLVLGGLDVIIRRLEACSVTGDMNTIEAILQFIDKLLDNPDPKIMDRVVEFLKFADIEIAADGDVICYKAVNTDYTDCYTGTLDNRPGAVVKMKRRLVDDNCSVECSQGLHVCSLKYVNSFWGRNRRLMKVKLNPADIVAIPKDYNGSKIRCCKYLVIEDATNDWVSGKLKTDHACRFKVA